MAKDINKILADMRKSGKIKDWKGKGDAGEDAVLNICLERQRRMGGLLYQSFEYPYQSNRSGKTYTGNIKFENNQYVEYTESKRGMFDEIDVLFITDYRVFAIEVKSYHSDNIRVYDHWFSNMGSPVPKSPIAQAEKHARHLYHAIYDVLPDGKPQYIVPICCFVDRCKIKDERSDAMRFYIPISILNNFKQRLMEYNTPLEYNLDLRSIKNKLSEIKTSVRKEFT